MSADECVRHRLATSSKTPPSRRTGEPHVHIGRIPKDGVSPNERLLDPLFSVAGPRSWTVAFYNGANRQCHGIRSNFGR